jgi:hypothetical protein
MQESRGLKAGSVDGEVPLRTLSRTRDKTHVRRDFFVYPTVVLKQQLRELRLLTILCHR